MCRDPHHVDPSSVEFDASGRDRYRACAGWPRRSTGPGPHPAWRARPGSFDSPSWDSLAPVEGRSRQYRRECFVDLSGERRSTYAGPGPYATEARSRVGRRTSPAATTEQPTQSGKQRPVRRPKGGSGHLPTEDRNLVAEHDDLDRQLFVVVPGEAEQIKDSDECNVEKRQGHDPVSSSGPFNESPTQGARMTFSAPTPSGASRCRRQCG